MGADRCERAVSAAKVSGIGARTSGIEGCPTGSVIGATAAASPGPSSPAKVSGAERLAHRSLGHTMTKARPMMFSIGTCP